MNRKLTEDLADVKDYVGKMCAYVRIDLKPDNEINPALAELCGQWGIQSVWLPFQRLNRGETRKAIARYLLEED